MQGSLQHVRAVSVVTRTQDRPVTLNRAFESVASQTFRDFEWVIVNDGGKREPVDILAEKARSAGLSVRVIHIETSHGMEAASNAGLRTVQSEYFAIHDDDDSWQPDFLDVTVQFLRDNPHHKGVMVHCWRVLERIEGGVVTSLSRAPHQPLLDSVRISDLLTSNISPPISFLYRTDLLPEIGCFDEDMEILGDWDFNLRVALSGEIGVVPSLLANYHVRAQTVLSGGAYRNSVPPGDKRQKYAEVRYRNRKLREDLKQGRFGLGVMLNLAVLSRPKPAGRNFWKRWLAMLNT